MSSDNPTSADNQQERLVHEVYRTTTLRGFKTRRAGGRSKKSESSETIRKAPPRSMEDEDMAHAL